ncbi:MAG: hypothetical protein ACKOWF_01395 [Chloroflexota bacterium]
MDPTALDRLARLLAGRQSRRSGLRAVLGVSGLFGIALPGGGARPAVAAPASSRKPRAEGPCGDGGRAANTCATDRQCCTRVCNLRAGRGNTDGMGRCRCLKCGKPCHMDRNCCGGRACVAGICGGSKPKPPPPPPPVCTPIVCPDCAFTAIQAAIDAADPGATIGIAPGTYVENLVIARDLVLAGCPTATVIDAGNWSGPTITITGGPTVELVDLVIDGSPGASWPQPGLNGGGITCDGNLILSGATLVTHGAHVSLPPGGCVSLGTNATLTMNDQATIAECAADTYGGGGVSASQGNTVTMNDASAIRDCRSANSSSGGIGMYIGTLIMNGTATIAGNTAGNGGGGLRASLSTVTLNGQSSITGNTATSGDGGGISAEDTTVELNDSASISGNTAGASGGGVLLTNTSIPSALTLTGTATITGNGAASGGGVYSNQPSNTLSAPAGSITGNTPDQCAGSGISCP